MGPGRVFLTSTQRTHHARTLAENCLRTAWGACHVKVQNGILEKEVTARAVRLFVLIV